MKSADIIAILANRHTNDVFVPECKDGPTWYGNHLRMDAWAMKRSWLNPLVTAYEVKVSRSDFLNDTKWQGYLNYCNELYFACPSGMIKADEVGKDVGLIYVTEGASRCYIKKKAVYRQVEIPEAMYQYVIMCRAKIVGPKAHERVLESGRELNRQKWEEWLKQKEEDRYLGQACSKAIRAMANTMKYENGRLKREIEGLKVAAAALKELGIDPNYCTKEHIERRVVELSGMLSVRDLSRLEDARDALEEIIEAAKPRGVVTHADH